MQENGELIKLVSMMLDELRDMKKQQSETNSILKEHTKILSEHTQILNRHSEKFDKVENELGKIRIILNQHDRDLMKIADLLETRVVHWGDRIIVEGNPRVSGVVAKAA
ncbi:MAG: hypothetical protein FJ218_00660 [Ignavibacteria bacterium]|nr:hypothetical protein [Ignavibacteria bacterium]